MFAMKPTNRNLRLFRWATALLIALGVALTPAQRAAVAAPPPALPDLIPYDLKLQDAGGFQFNVQFKVKNQGKADASAITVWLVPGKETDKQVLQIDRLPAGKSKQFNLTLPDPLVRGIAPQLYVVITVDPGNTIAESNEGNNQLTAPLAFSPAPLPDLVVDQVTLVQTSLILPSVQVTVRVKNQGQADAPGFDVRVWQPETPQTVNTLTLSAGLKAGQSHDFQLTSKPANLDPATYIAAVDPLNRVRESNEGNNQGSAQLNIRSGIRITPPALAPPKP
jgi:subtilase family serine protease